MRAPGPSLPRILRARLPGRVRRHSDEMPDTRVPALVYKAVIGGKRDSRREMGENRFFFSGRQAPKREEREHRYRDSP